MIDIHMHLIPGMDDGAEDMEMALVMMIRAQQQGISQIIATPHSETFHFSKEDGRVIFKRLAAAVAKVCPDMRLYLGCEVYCEADIMEQVLELLDSKFYPTMNGDFYFICSVAHPTQFEQTIFYPRRFQTPTLQKARCVLWQSASIKPLETSRD